MKKVILWVTVSAVFIAGLVLVSKAAYKLWEYKTGEAVYEELEDNFTGEDHGGGTDKQGEEEDADSFTVNWDELLAQNKDIVGWIRMTSGASYPILRGESDDTYLYHDMYGGYNINGSIFLHYANSGKWYDKNSLIYGHNMNSGAMFGSNRQYKDETFAKENPEFYIYTPDGRYTYRIFAVVVTEDVSECYNPDIQNDKEMKNFLEIIRKEAMYNLAEAEDSDHIVTLSTCTGHAHGSTRLLLLGYMDSFKSAKDGKIMDRKTLQYLMKDARMTALAKEYEPDDSKTGGM